MRSVANPLLLALLALASARCASRDHAPGDAAAEEIPCTPLAHPSRRPNVADDGDSETFTVATRHLDVGERNGPDGLPTYPEFGFDLDGRCTTSEATATCQLPSWAVQGVDHAYGRDNNYGAIPYLAKQMGRGSASEAADGFADSGNASAAIRVREYNGESDDPQVEVSFYAVTRIDPQDVDAGLSPTAWDGTDVWRALEAWLANPEAVEAGDDIEPAFVDDDAYVVDGVLVARFPTLLVAIGPLSQATLTATIVHNEDASPSLVDGTIAGRLGIDDLLAAAEAVKLCTYTPGYAQIKAAICAVPDISFEGPDDGSRPCDAVSLGYRFDAEPAAIDGMFPSELSESHYCRDGGSPDDDDCASLADLPRDAGADASD